MEFIEQIRQVANIVDIASQYTTLKQRGRRHVGLCPFHSEKTPSFVVDEEKQLFHCFGCGIGGDVFSLVMEKENLNFPEAIKFLAEKYHIPLPQQKKLSPQVIKLEEQLFKINESALAFFKKNLYTSQEGKAALDYLKKRNISENTVQELKLGYALNIWDSLLNYFKGKNIAPPLLEKAGLVLPGKKKDEYYDRFRGRVIFPIFSLTGRVVGFGGRTLFGAEPKYMNSPDTPVYSKGKLLYGLNFTKEAIRHEGELILVEGYTDFAALYQAGQKNCAASLGTSLTAEQAGLAMRFAPKIIINYDGDSAGKVAASRAVSLYFENGIEPKILILPENLDPDSFLQKYGIAKYQELSLKSMPLIDFLINQFTPQGGIKTPNDKIQIAKNILKITLLNPNTLIGSEYIKELSERLSLDEKVVRDTLHIKLSEDQIASNEIFLPAEKRLLQIIIENKDMRPYIFAEMDEDDFKGLKSEPIFRIICNWFKKEKDLIFHELKEAIGPVLASQVARALFEKGKIPTVDEALDCLRALRKFSKQKQLKELQIEITKLDKRGEKEKVLSLLSQKQDLAKEILSLEERYHETK